MLSDIFKVSPHTNTYIETLQRPHPPSLTAYRSPHIPDTLPCRHNLLLLDPGVLFIYPSGRTPASTGAYLCLH